MHALTPPYWSPHPPSTAIPTVKLASTVTVTTPAPRVQVCAAATVDIAAVDTTLCHIAAPGPVTFLSLASTGQCSFCSFCTPKDELYNFAAQALKTTLCVKWWCCWLGGNTDTLGGSRASLH